MDLRGRWGRAPSGVEILSFLCSFWGNFDQILGWHPHLGGWRPPPLGNPGSAPGFLLRPVHTKRNHHVNVNVMLTGGTFDVFDGNCDGENGLHNHFARQSSVCCDGVAPCEQGLSSV